MDGVLLSLKIFVLNLDVFAPVVFNEFCVVNVGWGRWEGLFYAGRP